MSQVAISGNASGTGTLTIAAPNTNSNYTLTLPAATGTVASIASVNNNGVVYTNSSGQPTTGTAFVFDGTNVGIGTSSPSYQLNTSKAAGSGDAGQLVRFTNTSTGNSLGPFHLTIGTTNYFAGNPGIVLAGTNGIALAVGDGSDLAAQRKATIDSSGHLLVGTTSADGAAVGIRLFSTNQVQASKSGDWSFRMGRRDSTGIVTEIYYNSTRVGDIATNGTGTTYNSASDYRLKENVQPMVGALERVALLKPCTYTWKINGSTGEGFIAHELQEIVPDAVNGIKDAVDTEGNIVPQSIDTSFLVATLTAAIQEQQALIQQLQADVAELKGATP